VKCWVRDEVPNLETEDVVLGQLLHTSESRDRWIWSNGRMMVSRVKPKKLRKNLLQWHFDLHESDMMSPGMEPKVPP
jgi:hypothetical protein